MNISDFVKSQAAAHYLAGNANALTPGRVSAPANTGLEKAEKRIQTQVDTTSAQLSSFGKLKSSVSSTQIAAHALGALATTASSSTEKTAVNNFVSAFNSTVNSAKATAGVPGETTTGANSANRVHKDLLRAVGPDAPTIDALKRVGFNVNTNGNLVLDAKKFDAAQKADPASVRATLTKLGQLVDKSATQELASTGNVGGSLSSLTPRTTFYNTPGR